MKTKEMAKKGLYVGTGLGIVLFALVGLLPGSMIGGIIGLKMSQAVLGEVTQTVVLSRLIVAIGMIGGVITSAITFIFGAGLLGWVTGCVIETIKNKEKEMIDAKAHVMASK